MSFTKKLGVLMGLGTLLVTTALPAFAGPGRCPWGPDTCKQGYVWREANKCDHVCVHPDVRAQAAADNAAASERYAGGGAYGPYTCKEGFVWREAFAGDHVCVTPAVRAQAAADNREAMGRYKGCL